MMFLQHGPLDNFTLNSKGVERTAYFAIPTSSSAIWATLYVTGYQSMGPIPLPASYAWSLRVYILSFRARSAQNLCLEGSQF